MSSAYDAVVLGDSAIVLLAVFGSVRFVAGGQCGQPGSRVHGHINRVARSDLWWGLAPVRPAGRAASKAEAALTDNESTTEE